MRHQPTILEEAVVLMEAFTSAKAGAYLIPLRLERTDKRGKALDRCPEKWWNQQADQGKS